MTIVKTKDSTSTPYDAQSTHEEYKKIVVYCELNNYFHGQ